MSEFITNFAPERYYRMEIFTLHSKVADTIEANPRIIMVLERLGIFSGVYDKSIEEIAADYTLNPNLLLTLINIQCDNFSKQYHDINITDIPVVIGFLRHSHDYFQNEIYPTITGDIERMAAGENKKEIKMLERFFNSYCKEVEEHFAYENNTAFPYIEELYRYKCEQRKDNSPSHPYSVGEYKSHHNDIEETLNDLKSLLIKFLTISDNFHLKRNIVLNLFELDHDLRAHTKVENDILIPLVQELEN